MLRQAEPARLGRFQIRQRLGRGAQGEVYLAEDTRLDRRVAIKTMRLNSRDPAEQSRRLYALLEEARIVSQLAHPGIVTLYDAGEDGGVPYLVFEYVEGRTLAARLREARRLPPAEAVEIAIQVLKALGYAHAKGVVHRDIKPANIMLAADTARVMDFGIAQVLSAQPADDDPFTGTPAYLAPEYIAEGKYTGTSDVFAVGMLLYEMLTGRPAICGENAFETLHRQVTEAFVPPSGLAADIDERLDSLVMQAIAKAPQARFPTAASMENALYLYLNPEPAAAPAAGEADKQATLQFLLRRMRHKSDFPALSSMIGAVNRAANSDTERLSELSNSILKDFALTSKLLKLVNTAFYGQFSGTISTVSRAVVILGFENVRQVAVTLALFEHLQNKSQAGQLREEILASYFTGLLGRELVSEAGMLDSEEAFICALFHSLGRLVTAYYLHEEFQEICRLQRGSELDEARAAPEPIAPPSRSAERSVILNAGIQDITNSLVGDCELNDILRMILETMYRGIGFTRVLLCVRDPASNSLRARFGFGADVDQIVRRGFQVPLAPSADAFHVAISNGADLLIEDIDSERIRDHIPEWYRAQVPARSLALFPVMVKSKPVGLLYGDSDRAGTLSFEPAELNLLKTLRNQAVLAVTQQSVTPAAPTPYPSRAEPQRRGGAEDPQRKATNEAGGNASPTTDVLCRSPAEKATTEAHQQAPVQERFSLRVLCASAPLRFSFSER